MMRRLGGMVIGAVWLSAWAGGLRGQGACTPRGNELELMARAVIDGELFSPSFAFPREAGGGFRVRWARLGSALLVSNGNSFLASSYLHEYWGSLYEMGDYLPRLLTMHTVLRVTPGEDYLMRFGAALAGGPGMRLEGPCTTLVPLDALAANRPIPAEAAKDLVSTLKLPLTDSLKTSYPSGTACKGDVILPYSLETLAVGRVVCRSYKRDYDSYFWAMLSPRGQVLETWVAWDTPSRNGWEPVYEQLKDRPRLAFDLVLLK